MRTNLCIEPLGLGHMVLVTGLHASLQSNHFLFPLTQLGAQPRLHTGHLRFLSRQLLVNRGQYNQIADADSL